jgi:4'-phosphopantetheinyl transferase
VEHAWSPGPLSPRLDAGAVHVWQARLKTVTDGLVGLLSPAERARAERFMKAHDRERWIRAHGVLRALLGRYLKMDPRTLRLVTGPHGKPALAPGGDPAMSAQESTSAKHSRLSFNLAHSGDLALYAFTETGAVGVDVQVARRLTKEVALAARTFGPAEARRLERLGRATREREFLQAWTRHEARMKCLGTGIGHELTDDDGRQPWIAALDVGERAAAALALERPPRELRSWEWR